MIDQLVAEYEKWCADNKLPYISADELLVEDITAEQKEYLQEFIKRWDEEVEKL